MAGNREFAWFDAYTVKARLFPAFLVVLPLCLTLFAWLPIPSVWGIVWSLVVGGGGNALLAQIGRDLGKKKENNLFALWGGKPSSRLLRHQDMTNKNLLTQRHQRLQALLPDIVLPSQDEEKINPHAADQIYDACTTRLRTLTRDTKRFNLVFEENCNYGFRRNLWGLKPIGLGITVLSLIIIDVLIMINGFVGSEIPLLYLLATIVNFAILLIWLFWITPNWVKTAAEAYAERLIEAIEVL